jgi:sec-independent protein translocase protein TatA
MLSLGHLFLVLLIVFLLFGAQKFPKMMEDLAKGYKAFMKGIQNDDPALNESAETPFLDKKPLKDQPAQVHTLDQSPSKTAQAPESFQDQGLHRASLQQDLLQARKPQSADSQSDSLDNAASKPEAHAQ